MIILRYTMVFTKTLAIARSLIAIHKKPVEKEGIRENGLVDINLKKVKLSGFAICNYLNSFKKEDELNLERTDT